MQVIVNFFSDNKSEYFVYGWRKKKLKKFSRAKQCVNLWGASLVLKEKKHFKELKESWIFVRPHSVSLVRPHSVSLVMKG